MARPHKLDPDELQRLHGLYSTGSLSNRKLGAEFGLSEAAVRKLATQHRWQKTLEPVIRAEGKALDARAAAAEHIERDTATPVDAKALRADQIVEAGAQIQASIRAQHRARLRRLHDHADTLLGELNELADGAASFKDAFDGLVAAAQKSENPDIAKALMEVNDAISTPERIKAFKALAEATDRLVTAERKLYGLDEPEDKGGSLQDHLDSLPDAG